jgi:hypothetical protein
MNEEVHDEYTIKEYEKWKATREKYIKKGKGDFWSGMRESMEVRLTMVCSLLFLSTILLGIFSYVLGISVVTVDFRVHFDIAIGLILFVVGLIFAWLFTTWYLAKIAKLWIDFRREEIAIPRGLE